MTYDSSNGLRGGLGTAGRCQNTELLFGLNEVVHLRLVSQGLQLYDHLGALLGPEDATYWLDRVPTRLHCLHLESDHLVGG